MQSPGTRFGSSVAESSGATPESIRRQTPQQHNDTLPVMKQSGCQIRDIPQSVDSATNMSVLSPDAQSVTIAPLGWIHAVYQSFRAGFFLVAACARYVCVRWNLQLRLLSVRIEKARGTCSVETSLSRIKNPGASSLGFLLKNVSDSAKGLVQSAPPPHPLRGFLVSLISLTDLRRSSAAETDRRSILQRVRSTFVGDDPPSSPDLHTHGSSRCTEVHVGREVPIVGSGLLHLVEGCISDSRGIIDRGDFFYFYSFSIFIWLGVGRIDVICLCIFFFSFFFFLFCFILFFCFLFFFFFFFFAGSLV